MRLLARANISNLSSPFQQFDTAMHSVAAASLVRAVPVPYGYTRSRSGIRTAKIPNRQRAEAQIEYAWSAAVPQDCMQGCSSRTDTAGMVRDIFGGPVPRSMSSPVGFSSRARLCAREPLAVIGRAIRKG